VLSDEQVQLIRNELEAIVSSSAFVGSKRGQEFLRLVVNHALAGRIDSLRERMIGVEMFGRKVDYDTSNDSVVRVRASEVRRRLNEYYSGLHSRPPVRLDLPPGSYVPIFHWEQPETVAPSPEEPRPPISTQDSTTATPAGTGKKTFRVDWRVLTGLAVAALTLMAIATYVTALRRVPSPGNIRSVAVLPLTNLSGDPKEEYLADAMTEELTTSLGHISALRVISRTSTSSYKHTNKVLPEIARELGVDAVVEGSVFREGNQARITAQLIDARTDRHIWAASYDRHLSSVLALLGEVAQEIADAVRIALTPEERTRLARGRPVDLQAQDLYLMGQHLMDSGKPQDALPYFQKAVAQDPDFARAHAGLADTYGLLGRSGLMAYSESFRNQQAEAQRAIALDEALDEAHVQLGIAAENLNWDWGAEETQFKRALELNPSSASGHWAYCLLLEKVGRIDEALGQTKIALALEPVSARPYLNAADAFYYAREYDRALVHIKQLPETIRQRNFLEGVIYREKGAYDQAINAFLKLKDDPHGLGHLGNAYARAGRFADARVTIQRLQEHMQKDGIGAYEVAAVYAGLGDKEQAFAWLEKAYSERNKGMTYLKLDPCLDPLRSDSRFASLLRRVGLPL